MTLTRTNRNTPCPVVEAVSPSGEEPPLLGKEVKVYGDKFFPEAIGIVEAVRGYGSLQAVEVRIHPGQPGARVRVAFKGVWELIEGGEV